MPRHDPDRRRWLAAAAAVAAPLGARAATPGRARSVLFLFAGGGMSQLDTLDPKPAAPAEVRGAFATTATAVPGLRFCEHLPETARRAGRFAVVRSLTHDDLDHGSASYLTLTGHFHPRKSSNPPPRPTDVPGAGAVVSRLGAASGRFPAAAVNVNGPMLVPLEVGPGQDGGFLGRAHAPLVVGDVSAGASLVGGLTPPADLTPGRAAGRRGLLAALDPAPRAEYARAYGLLADGRCRDAFDLGREPDALRDRYSRTRMGQACLLGRRLVEAGVPWVTVFLNHTIRGQDVTDDGDACGWDTHNDIFEHMRGRLLPRFDRAFAALLDDLSARGLLATTLVVLAGEFGRSPRVAVERNFAGTSPGRKHWAMCYSAVLAGAGVPCGAVVGASDRLAAYPAERPCGPADVMATAFAALGYGPGAEYRDAAGRPYAVCTGRPLFG